MAPDPNQAQMPPPGLMPGGMQQVKAFRPLHTYEENERESKDTRVFYGDGSPFLRCPGLLKLAKIRLCGFDLPEARVDRVLLDASGANFGYQRVEYSDLSFAADGCAIVRRSEVSNDGNWQSGVQVFVTGEWDEAVPPTPLPAPQPVIPPPPGAAARGRRPHGPVQE